MRMNIRNYEYDSNLFIYMNFYNRQGVNLSYHRLRTDQTKTVFLGPNDFKRNKSYYKLLKPLFYMLYYTNGLTIKTKFNLKAFNFIKLLS